LPNRRRGETKYFAVGGVTLTAAIGIDAGGSPAEVFLSGAKDASGMAAILDDVSVVISVALQHGIPARSLAKSIARRRLPLAPPYVDHAPGTRPAASVTGAVLDLLVGYKGGTS
jgi:hypothetical protein